jgi:hypothetical protein
MAVNVLKKRADVLIEGIVVGAFPARPEAATVRLARTRTLPPTPRGEREG